MRGIERREKRYVEVIADMDEDGRVVPLEVVWADGRHFAVSKILDVRRRASMKVGGTGICYTVRVGGSRESTYLFREGDRWFVEAKVPGE